VAHVLRAVKLDLMPRVERIKDQLAMLEGEWRDYEKCRAGAYAIQSLKYSRRP
jgi:hypothetical protein